MRGNEPNTQDKFLAEQQKSGKAVSIYFVDGSKLQGTIEQFDNFTLIVKDAAEQLVYKHAIIKITPTD